MGLILFFIIGLFNSTVKPFVIFGIMAGIPTLAILLLLYFSRPSKEHDNKEFVFVQFKDESLKISLRKEHTLRGNMRDYLIDEIKYPKITYQIFEIPYNSITNIKESGGNGVQNSYYCISYSSDADITKPGIYIRRNNFDVELRQWFVKLGAYYNLKTFS